MSLITLKTFTYQLQAHLVRTKLESEGIQCFLHDENIVSIMPIYDVLVGGIKLKVKKEQLQEAQAILLSIDQEPILDKNSQQVLCTNCMSNELVPTDGVKPTFWGALKALTFAILPFNRVTEYRCLNCDTRFKAN